MGYAKATGQQSETRAALASAITNFVAIASRANREYGQVMNENMKFLETERQTLETGADLLGIPPLELMRARLSAVLFLGEKAEV